MQTTRGDPNCSLLRLWLAFQKTVHRFAQVISSNMTHSLGCYPTRQPTGGSSESQGQRRLVTTLLRFKHSKGKKKKVSATANQRAGNLILCTFLQSLTNDISAQAGWPWVTQQSPTMNNDAVSSPTGTGQHFVFEAWKVSRLLYVLGKKQSLTMLSSFTW